MIRSEESMAWRECAWCNKRFERHSGFGDFCSRACVHSWKMSEQREATLRDSRRAEESRREQQNANQRRIEQERVRQQQLETERLAYKAKMEKEELDREANLTKKRFADITSLYKQKEALVKRIGKAERSPLNRPEQLETVEGTLEMHTKNILKLENGEEVEVSFPKVGWFWSRREKTLEEKLEQLKNQANICKNLILRIKESHAELEAMKAELSSVEYEIEQEERRLNGMGLTEEQESVSTQSRTSPTQSSNSKIDDLRYLTDMLKEGLLSREEFEREKKKLLGN